MLYVYLTIGGIAFYFFMGWYIPRIQAIAVANAFTILREKGFTPMHGESVVEAMEEASRLTITLLHHESEGELYVARQHFTRALTRMYAGPDE